MTGAERLDKALNFTEADRVPLDLSGTTVSAFSKYAFVSAMAYKNWPVKYYPKSVDPIQQIVTPEHELLEKLKIDTYRVGARRIMNFEEKLADKNSYLSIIDPYECEWRMKEGDLYFNQATYPYQNYDTVSEALQDFSIYDISEYRQVLAADIEEQLAHKGNRGLIIDRNCAGLTEMSLRIRGYDTWFMDTMIDPEGVKSLLDLLVDHKIAYWELLAEILLEKGVLDQVQVVAEADDLGTQNSLLLSPDSLQDIVMPRITRLMQYLKKQFPSAKTFFHTDGSVKQIIPDLIEAGIDILNPIQYSAEGMDLVELKKEFGKDLVFWGGGIDTQEVLNKATPEQVRDEVKRNIEILAPGGGYVFTTVHNIQADVPPENFWAMWDSMMEFGEYK
jgi:uroporphyrinogen decarboxylase